MILVSDCSIFGLVIRLVLSKPSRDRTENIGQVDTIKAFKCSFYTMELLLLLLLALIGYRSFSSFPITRDSTKLFLIFCDVWLKKLGRKSCRQYIGYYTVATTYEFYVRMARIISDEWAVDALDKSCDALGLVFLICFQFRTQSDNFIQLFFVGYK